MEDPWSNTFEQLSGACRALRLDPNYSPSNCSGFTDDDDPLGHPEMTVKINDDWTVSSDEDLHAVSENERENNDEAEIAAIDSFLDDISSLSEKKLSSDEEDQIVPPSAKKICKIIFPGELTLSVKQIAAENVEGFDYQYEKDKEEEQEQEQEPEEEEKEEEEEEKEEGEGEAEGHQDLDKEEEREVSDEIIANRSKVEEATENRSNPQPP